MDRSALFVDAGYLLAAGADLLTGKPARRGIECNYEGLLQALAAEVKSHHGGEFRFLRTYWYDGAHEGVATADQHRVGSCHYVKLRLGRLNKRGQQKGVDGLIYRDMTALARAGAISRAYLLSGDEDLREGVVTAQELGVQVVLLTFATTKNTGASRLLLREVDECWRLDDQFWRKYMNKVSDKPTVESAPDAAAVEVATDKFAAEWLKGTTKDELEQLALGTSVPNPIYVNMLESVESDLGISLRNHNETKRAMKKRFKQQLRASSPGSKIVD